MNERGNEETSRQNKQTSGQINKAVKCAKEPANERTSWKMSKQEGNECTSGQMSEQAVK